MVTPREQIPALQVAAPTRVAKDDAIRVDVYNATSGVTILLVIRMLRPNGDVIDLTRQVVPTSDRLVSTNTFPLPEGWLYSVSARNDGFTRVGQTYVVANLVKSGQAVPSYGQALMMGYVAGGYVLGWPGAVHHLHTAVPGLVRSVAGTDPAAGIEVSETVPTGARWRLFALRAELITSVVVANRRPHVVIDDGVNTLFDVSVPNTVPASSTREYSFVAGYPITQDLGFNEVTVPLPALLDLMAGYRIRTRTEGLDVGDNWNTVRLYVMEWIDPGT